MPNLPPGRPIPPEVDFDKVPSRERPSQRFRPQGASVSLVATTYHIDPDSHISLSHTLHACLLPGPGPVIKPYADAQCADARA